MRGGRRPACLPDGPVDCPRFAVLWLENPQPWVSTRYGHRVSSLIQYLKPTAKPYPSSASLLPNMDFDPKHDRLHHSLSSAWSSFLNAQHCTKEVCSLRRALDDHVRQANVAIASVQRDVAHTHGLVTSALADAKTKAEEQNAKIAEQMRGVQERVAKLEREGVGRGNGKDDGKVRELEGRVNALQEKIGQIPSGAGVEDETVRTLMTKMDMLQAEVRELREGKAAVESKLAALELKIAAMAEREPLGEDVMGFLQLMHSRRKSLMKVLDDVEHGDACEHGKAPVCFLKAQLLTRAVLTQLAPEPSPQDWGAMEVATDWSSTPPFNPRPTRNSIPLSNYQPQAQPQIQSQLQSRSQPLLHPPSTQHQQDLHSLYLFFRDRYKAKPPKNDVSFIWQFLRAIRDPELSRHVQESLAVLLPHDVTRRKESTRLKKEKYRYITIDKGLTWRRFREALVRIPSPQ